MSGSRTLVRLQNSLERDGMALSEKTVMSKWITSVLPVIRPELGISLVDFPGSPQPVNFTRSEALQFRDSIPVAAAVPKFPLRLK